MLDITFVNAHLTLIFFTLPEPLILAACGAALILMRSIVAWRRKQERAESVLQPDNTTPSVGLYTGGGSNSNSIPAGWDGPFEPRKTAQSWQPTKSDVGPTTPAH